MGQGAGFLSKYNEKTLGCFQPGSDVFMSASAGDWVATELEVNTGTSLVTQ